MNKEYEKKFQDEIERILNELYHHPITTSRTSKRAVISAEKRFVSYLVKHDLVSNIRSISGGSKFGIQLESIGYEVFEKYNGWYDYKKNVVDKELNIEKAKELSVKFWWMPIVISILSLILAIIALFRKFKISELV